MINIEINRNNKLPDGFNSWDEYNEAKHNLMQNNLYVIKNNPDGYLQRDKSKKGYICPLCNSGSGKNGTGLTAMKTTPPKFTCWSCHGFKDGGDLLDIISVVNNFDLKTDFIKIYEYACKIMNLQIEPTPNAVYKIPVKVEKETEPETEKQADFTPFINKSIEELRNNNEALNYLYSRGLTDNTINHFKLGYNNESKSIIIPYNSKNTYYVRRRIDTNDSGQKYRKPKSDEAGREPLYNAGVYGATENIFVVEGFFDAMAVQQSGGRAVALGTTGSPRAFKEFVKKHKYDYKGVYIIALDNDKPKADGRKAGQEGQEKLINFFKEEEIINYIEFPLTADYKDACEMLEHDAHELKENVKEALLMAENFKASRRQIKPLKYYKDDFRKHREDIKQSIRTGFLELDIALGGGLNNELYVMGADTGTGKSAITTILAQNIAQQGIDVLYFALEMGRDEFIARGASMVSFELKKKDGIPYGEILNDKYDHNAKVFTRRAYTDYEIYIDEYFNRYGDHLHIIEGGLKRITADEITTISTNYKEETGAKQLVIIVDYLQLLAGNPKDATQRDTMGIMSHAIAILKSLASQIGATVFCISSMANDRKGATVNDSSFKYSGDIGYTGGVLLGWNWEGVTDTNDIDKRDNAIEQSKRLGYRPMCLEVLKNRNGARDKKIKLKYFPAYNYIIQEDGNIEALKPIINANTTRLNADRERAEQNIKNNVEYFTNALKNEKIDL